MLKFVEIAKAWLAAANPTPEQQALADNRISICNECPHRKYTKQFDIHVCGQCGCPLSKKIFSPINSCPDKRWKQ